MSNMIENIIDQKMLDQEQLTAVELTDKELESINGGWGFFPQSNNSTAFAVTTIAFSNNNNSSFPCF
jgi:bacteriocin-like protein